MIKKFLAVFCSLAFSTAVLAFSDSVIKTSAEEIDAGVYYDIDGDSNYDIWFDIKADLDNLTCSIENMNIYNSLTDVVIPSELEYFSNKLTVTSINGVGSYNQSYLTSVDIPYTVTYIEPQTVGYYLSYVYDYDTGNYTQKNVKNENLKIKCTLGTAGEDYAKENLFAYDSYKNLNVAQVYVNGTFTYTGGEITPVPTIIFDEQPLVNGRDFVVYYENNVNAGTATVFVEGIGEYRGLTSADFTIGRKQAGSVVISAISSKNYTGKAISPTLTIRDNGKLLIKNRDYTTTFYNNTNIGTATGRVTFIGNYTGQRTVTFKIIVAKISNFKASASSTTSVNLSWSSVKCSEYRIYRYSPKKNTYVLIATTTKNSYKNTGLSQATQYKYKIKASVNGVYGTTSAVSCVTKVKTPTLKIATQNKSVKIMWDKNTKCTGFKIYRYVADTDDYWWWGVDPSMMTTLKVVRDSSAKTFTNKNLSNNKTYYYMVQSYVKIDGKNYYSDYSEIISSASAGARLNGATLKSHTSYKVYNRQGTKQTSYTVTLSKSDINTLKKFAKTHFKTGMTREEKVETTLDWINRNVKYARGEDWNDIAGKTWVDAIFNSKKGQCAQYNGALIAMMAYLGYDVNIVQGYRGQANSNLWQHFWGEVKICGQTYVMEAGNYGEDGNWSYNCAKYSEAGGYIMYGKNY